VSSPRKYDDEFRERFAKMTNGQLIDALNGQANNAGWVSARASYLAALRNEFERRGYDYRSVRRATVDISPGFSQDRLSAFRHAYDPITSEKVELLDERFLLAREGRCSVFYAPFDAASSADTRLMFVGLTPGLSQMQLAAELFRSSQPETAMDPIAFARLLRRDVAFAGSMRKNLCAMLEELGLPPLFGSENAAELFSAARSDVATTSALQYPVFVGPTNANFGGTKDLSKSPLFREMLDGLLLPQILAAPRALIVPLGDSAGSGVRYLVRSRQLDDRRVLFGLPHPSGSNGHRVRHFADRKKKLREVVHAWFSITHQ
jgi:hypothetical protein